MNKVRKADIIHIRPIVKVDKFEFPYRPSLYYYGYSSLSTIFFGFSKKFFEILKGVEMYEKVERLMQEKGVKASDVAKAIGISSSVFTDWKKGRYTPKADKLYSIAQYFGVPMEYFFDEGEAIAQIQSNLNKYIKERPVYRASAGQGAYNDVYTADSISMGEEGYEYATVIGDSMLPELRDGDVIKIEPTAQTTAKDYTLIKIDGDDCTVKFVEVVDNGIWVRASNKEVFEDRFYSIQDVLTLPITIIGKVVAFRRML